MSKAVGKHRNDSAKAKGRKGAHGNRDDEAMALHRHIVGACAECAVAKLINRFWFQPDFRNRRDGDVGYGLHVRATDRQDGRLIVHDTDPDDGMFILAIQDIYIPARFDVVGFLYGADAKDQKWWWEDTPRPAFFVPREALVPIETLLNLEPV